MEPWEGCQCCVIAPVLVTEICGFYVHYHTYYTELMFQEARQG